MAAAMARLVSSGTGLPYPAAMQPWVVLPTYCEARTVAAVVEGVRTALPQAHVLVVDDASPDGTAAAADRAGAEVLRRPGKAGLGRAYIAGFRHALDGGATHVFEMDADLSHDPRDLPRLLAATAGADVVIGSRYVPSGGIENWHPLRRAVSRGGCWYARRVLAVDVRDLTGGFKCLTADALERINFATVRSQGYAFQVELTHRALRAGLRVVEVPIVFHERQEGDSKMTWRIAAEAAFMVPRLRADSRRR